MLIKDLTEKNFTYTHEFEYTVTDNYDVDVWVAFTSFEMVDALKNDDRFKWLPDYDLLTEESFCKLFTDHFIDLNEGLVCERAEENPEAIKAHW